MTQRNSHVKRHSMIPVSYVHVCYAHYVRSLFYLILVQDQHDRETGVTLHILVEVQKWDPIKFEHKMKRGVQTPKSYKN